MIKLFLGSILLIAGLVQADSLKCSNADASVQYDQGKRESGVPPRPGERMTWSDLTYQGTVFKSIDVSLTNKKLVTPDTQTRSYKYSSFIAVLNATPLMDDAPEVREFVICSQAIYIGPPRM